MRAAVKWSVRISAAAVIAIGCFLAVTIVLRQRAAFQRPDVNLIHIVQATYGGNCRASAAAQGHANLVRSGNYTIAATQTCNNTDAPCPIFVDSYRVGNPALACAKNFVVSWRCGTKETVHETTLEPEADEKLTWIDCVDR